MKSKLFVLIVCVSVVVLLFGFAPLQFNNVEKAVEDVHVSQDAILQDFTQFALMGDFAQAILINRSSMAQIVVERDDGWYLFIWYTVQDSTEFFGTRDVQKLYYLADNEEDANIVAEELLRPFVFAWETNNELFVSLESIRQDGKIEEGSVLWNILYFFNTIAVATVFVISAIIFLITFILDSIIMALTLVFAGLKIIGFIPV